MRRTALVMVPVAHRALRRLGLMVMAACALAACAPATRVVLLPQEDVPGSQVSVRTERGELLLRQPYEVAQVSDDGTLSASTTTAEAVADEFGRLLALRPPAPERFTLHFETGTAQLTPDSQARLDDVIERARMRAGGEILIIGHTDRVGSVAANDRLSLQRAEAIRDLLVARGFRAELIEAVGRGEREPLWPTEDEVAEPRNRRVEIVVR